MTLMTAVGAEVKSHLPCPPKSIVAFSEKMAKAGFVSRNLQVELPNSEAYDKLSNGELRRMNFIYRWGYQLKSFFKDDMLGSKFPEDIYIYNRNQNGEKSNFFVLARYTYMHGVQIMFSNPLGPDQKADDGKTGMDLKKDKVLLNLTCGMRTSKGFDVWADQVVAQIQKMASYKPENTYYAQAHGHWGYARGKLLMDLKVDDGRSHEMDVIMNMVLAHTDFDATGPHNHHYRPLFQDVSALEAAAGIVKVPACEVTMPIHLYDNYSVEHFVRILNERKDEINTLVDSLNAKRAELESGIDAINKATDSLGNRSTATNRRSRSTSSR